MSQSSMDGHALDKHRIKKKQLINRGQTWILPLFKNQILKSFTGTVDVISSDP